jgi:hypothetical protein
MASILAPVLAPRPAVGQVLGIQCSFARSQPSPRWSRHEEYIRSFRSILMWGRVELTGAKTQEVGFWEVRSCDGVSAEFRVDDGLTFSYYLVIHPAFDGTATTAQTTMRMGPKPRTKAESDL